MTRRPVSSRAVPLVVVTGIAEEAMDTTMLGLSWDLPDAVAVRHRIDPETQVLTRVVSDASGELERVSMTLEHACVACALREDVLPTLERLAREGRWATIVCCLPVAAEADQLCTVLARDHRLARVLQLSCVIGTLAGAGLVEDLLGDDLLHDRGLQTSPDDERGVGEVGCALVERADVVVLDGAADSEGRSLVQALARTDVPVVAGAENLGADTVRHRHHYGRSSAWCTPTLEVELPRLEDGRAWRLDLRSSCPFHPQRLLDDIEALGTGSHRSRGCFWLPSRPESAQEWGGSGGQLSIGPWAPWGRRTPFTRLLLTGVGVPPVHLERAFSELLLRPEESTADWKVAVDGLEPWLGDTDLAA